MDTNDFVLLSISITYCLWLPAGKLEIHLNTLVVDKKLFVSRNYLHAPNTQLCLNRWTWLSAVSQSCQSYLPNPVPNRPMHW